MIWRIIAVVCVVLLLMAAAGSWIGRQLRRRAVEEAITWALLDGGPEPLWRRIEHHLGEELRPLEFAKATRRMEDRGHVGFDEGTCGYFLTELGRCELVARTNEEDVAPWA